MESGFERHTKMFKLLICFFSIFGMTEWSLILNDINSMIFMKLVVLDSENCF